MTHSPGGPAGTLPPLGWGIAPTLAPHQTWSPSWTAPWMPHRSYSWPLQLRLTLRILLFPHPDGWTSLQKKRELLSKHFIFFITLNKYFLSLPNYNYFALTKQ